MCGYSGILFASKIVRDGFAPGLPGFRNASSRVAHRGDTEHQEYLVDQIWLKHYRLAFQDLEDGVQPMMSHDRTHVVVFNGEIYNHLDLREAITKYSGTQFKTRSDTETLIEGWMAFGEGFFEKLEGEYAFVILAVNGGSLIAHRDRFGVKPLFLRSESIDTRMFACFAENYSFNVECIEFSSEIKGIASPKTWCQDGLMRQFVGLFEPICTPFKNVFQLPPGGILQAKKKDGHFNCTLRPMLMPVRCSARSKVSATEKEFEKAFSISVADRLLSDVELGVYLSGGIDSKAVAFELGRMSNSEKQLKSFTVGFKHEGYDETNEAVRFAKYVGLHPHVVQVDSDALNYSYPLAVQSSELVQPFTNGAAKWWLSLFSRQYVQGVLTGDGADEVLCGYPSYRYANWWKSVMRGRGKAETPAEIMDLLKHTPLGKLHRDSLYISRFSSDTKNPWLSGSSASGAGTDFIDSIQLIGVPHPLFGQIHSITEVLLGPEGALNWLKSQAASLQSWFAAGLDGISPGSCNPENTLLMWQNYFARTHLPVHVLNWVGDRMEMANTLEGRTPFLSNRIRHLIYSQPDLALVSGLRDKVLLRKTYARLFPSEFANTPKKQFNAPFLDSDQLVRKYDSDSIFSETGLADNIMLEDLLKKASALKHDNPYQATHLRSVHQSAICMSIVHETIVNNKEITRDLKLEDNVLKSGGPV